MGSEKHISDNWDQTLTYSYSTNWKRKASYGPNSYLTTSDIEKQRWESKPASMHHTWWFSRKTCPLFACSLFCNPFLPFLPLPFRLLQVFLTSTYLHAHTHVRTPQPSSLTAHHSLRSDSACRVPNMPAITTPLQIPPLIKHTCMHACTPHARASVGKSCIEPSSTLCQCRYGTWPSVYLHLHVLSRFTCQHARQPPAGRPARLTQSIPRLRFLPEVWHLWHRVLPTLPPRPDPIFR